MLINAFVTGYGRDSEIPEQYDVSTGKRKRVSWLSQTEHDLNIAKKISARELKKIITKMIVSGQVHIGEIVVSLQYDVMTIP